MLFVKTKKYQLQTQTFIRIGFATVMKRYWWAFLVPIAIIIPGFIWPAAMPWVLGGAVLATILYLLFWYIQFYGLTQLPQGKFLFDKYAYYFDNNRILLMKNEKEGAPIQWDQIKKVEKRDNAMLLWFSPVQFLHLPYTIFNTNNEIRWLETMIRRKRITGLESETAKAA